MEEQKNNSETTVRDNIQEEATDALVKFIKSIASRFQTTPNEDKIEDLKPILQEVKDSLQKQVQLNKEIYDALITSQNDSIRRALLTPVIGIHDLMEENLDYIINKLPEDFGDNLEGKLDKVIELFVFIKGRIEEMLIHSHGLRIITPSEGDLFNPDEHCIVGTESTNNESFKDTIYRLEKSGFKDAKNGSIFKRAEVITMAYTGDSTSDNSDLKNN